MPIYLSNFHGLCKVNLLVVCWPPFFRTKCGGCMWVWTNALAQNESYFKWTTNQQLFIRWIWRRRLRLWNPPTIKGAPCSNNNNNSPSSNNSKLFGWFSYRHICVNNLNVFVFLYLQSNWSDGSNASCDACRKRSNEWHSSNNPNAFDATSNAEASRRNWTYPNYIHTIGHRSNVGPNFNNRNTFARTKCVRTKR